MASGFPGPDPHPTGRWVLGGSRRGGWPGTRRWKKLVDSTRRWYRIGYRRSQSGCSERCDRTHEDSGVLQANGFVRLIFGMKAAQQCRHTFPTSPVAWAPSRPDGAAEVAQLRHPLDVVVVSTRWRSCATSGQGEPGFPRWVGRQRVRRETCRRCSDQQGAQLRHFSCRGRPYAKLHTRNPMRSAQ